jgi:hypothetical protein
MSGQQRPTIGGAATFLHNVSVNSSHVVARNPNVSGDQRPCRGSNDQPSGGQRPFYRGISDSLSGVRRPPCPSKPYPVRLSRNRNLLKQYFKHLNAPGRQRALRRGSPARMLGEGIHHKSATEPDRTLCMQACVQACPHCCKHATTRRKTSKPALGFAGSLRFSNNRLYNRKARSG